MEQGELKNIVADILEMNINDDFDVSELIQVNTKRVMMIKLLSASQVGSEDGMSEYGDTDRLDEDGISLWQELRNETVRLESRKSSSSSQVRRIMT